MFLYKPLQRTVSVRIAVLIHFNIGNLEMRVGRDRQLDHIHAL